MHFQFRHLFVPALVVAILEPIYGTPTFLSGQPKKGSSSGESEVAGNPFRPRGQRGSRSINPSLSSAGSTRPLSEASLLPSGDDATPEPLSGDPTWLYHPLDKEKEALSRTKNRSSNEGKLIEADSGKSSKSESENGRDANEDTKAPDFPRDFGQITGPHRNYFSGPVKPPTE